MAEAPLRPSEPPVSVQVPARSAGWGWLLLPVEWLLILAWAVFVGRVYLNLDPSAWPRGGDFALQASRFYFWELAKECGLCSLWDGSFNGGNPALADWYGALLHPALVLPSLVLPPISAAKIAIILSMAMGGLAQWWTARALGLGLIARLWSAAFGVVGGHLTGRMEWGQVIMVMAVAAASLTIAPGLQLARTGHPRAAVWFAMTLALVAMNGHGYMQVAVLLGLLPALGLFLLDHPDRVRQRLAGFALAGCLALLLSAVHLMPVVHFFPEFGKSTSPEFIGLQPVEYLPLNLVVSDRGFFRNEVRVLGKGAGVESYYNFIGWIPIMLAVTALRVVPASQRRVLLFFVLAILFIWFVASGMPLRWIREVVPALASMRQPPLIAFYATPFVITLAAWGADILLRYGAPLGTRVRGIHIPAPSPVQLVVLGLLVVALRTAYDANQPGLVLDRVPAVLWEQADALDSSPTGWVRPPWGQLGWMLVLPERGLKAIIGRGDRQWGWSGRPDPPPTYLMDASLPADFPTRALGEIGGLYVMADDASPYAFISTADDVIPCRASARGGDIEVHCRTHAPGTLSVLENSYAGWQVRIDGAPAALRSGNWLSTAAPPGEHHYAFRYRPADVAVGALLTLVGALVCIAVLARDWRGHRSAGG